MTAFSLSLQKFSEARMIATVTTLVAKVGCQKRTPFLLEKPLDERGVGDTCKGTEKVNRHLFLDSGEGSKKRKFDVGPVGTGSALPPIPGVVWPEPAWEGLEV